MEAKEIDRLRRQREAEKERAAKEAKKPPPKPPEPTLPERLSRLEREKPKPEPKPQPEKTPEAKEPREKVERPWNALASAMAVFAVIAADGLLPREAFFFCLLVVLASGFLGRICLGLWRACHKRADEAWRCPACRGAMVNSVVLFAAAVACMAAATVADARYKPGVAFCVHLLLAALSGLAVPNDWSLDGPAAPGDDGAKGGDPA